METNIPEDLTVAKNVSGIFRGIKVTITLSLILRQFIRPAIVNAGWKPAEIQEECHFAAGFIQWTN